MSVSILTLGRRDHSARRRSNRCPIGVESMEGRALLASSAVNSAILSVEQAQLDVHQQIDQEILFLRSNILTIQDSTNTFIYNAKSDILFLRQDEIANPGNRAADRAAIAADQKNIRNGLRDEKFAIGQQNHLIRDLNNLSNQVDSTARNATRDLNRGRLDPANIQTGIDTETNKAQTVLTSIDNRATKDLNGLTSTLDSGTA